MTDIKNWLNTNDAAALTNYSQAYMRQLAQRGAVRAIKMGRDWLIHRESLLAYKARMDALGPAKHNPWRDDLVGGTGRHRKVKVQNDGETER